MRHVELPGQPDGMDEDAELPFASPMGARAWDLGWLLLSAAAR